MVKYGEIRAACHTVLGTDVLEWCKFRIIAFKVPRWPMFSCYSVCMCGGGGGEGRGEGAAYSKATEELHLKGHFIIYCVW